MKQRTIHIARILMVLYLLALTFLCLWNFSHLPDVSHKFMGIAVDKIIHFLMFLPFPMIFYLAVGKTPRKGWMLIVYILCIFALGCILGAATEFAQGLTKYRVSDPMDFRADAIGLAVCSLVVFIVGLFHVSASDDEA